MNDLGVPEHRIGYRSAAKTLLWCASMKNLIHIHSDTLFYAATRGLPRHSLKDAQKEPGSPNEFRSILAYKHRHNFDTCKNMENDIPKPFKNVQHFYLNPSDIAIWASKKRRNNIK